MEMLDQDSDFFDYAAKVLIPETQTHVFDKARKLSCKDVDSELTASEASEDENQKSSSIPNPPAVDRPEMAVH